MSDLETGTRPDLFAARQRLAENLPQATDILAGLLRIDNSYPPGRDFDVLADYLEPILQGLGLSCSRVTVPADLCDAPGLPGGPRINLLAQQATGKPACSLYFHTDTVPAGDGWTHPPHALTREGRTLYGRGAADTKGAVAAAWLALKTLRDLDVPLAYDPQLLLCTDEEGGRYPGIRYLAEQKLIRGHLLNFNGTAAPRIWGGCFGSMDIRIEIDGLAAHSGEPWRGINAIQAALPLLNRLDALAAEVAQRASDLVPPPHYPAGQPLHAHLTLAAVHAGGDKGSQVPGRCTVLLNRRYAPHENAQAVYDEIRILADAVLRGTAARSWRTELMGHLAPVSDPDGPHWPRWQAALQAGFGYAPGDFVKYGATSSSDMGWVQQQGIREILLGGLIRPESRIHGPDEHTTLDDLLALADSVLCYLAAAFQPAALPEGSPAHR